MKTKTIKQFMIAVVALIGLLPIRGVAATATLSIEDFTIKQGETKEMLIDVNNANMQVTMVEFYMQLPSGLSVATENGELAVDIAGRTTWKKHSLEASITDGTVHFFLYSGSNAVLTGTSGAVISVRLTASSSFTGGNIVFERQLITAPDETECKPANYIYKVETTVDTEEEIITFADDNVKAICVANWDANGDGELSKSEAAAVTDLGTVFKNNKKISSFEELHYFTGLTSIGNDAFNYCRSLTSISIPSSVTSIGNHAFDHCNNLTNITIPNSVTSIGDRAFSSCSGLTSITIPNSVTSIGDWAFSSCSGLTSITIPNSVTSIGYWAFYGCSGLISVEFHCKDIESWFRNNISIKEVIIGDEVTNIGEGAFDGCGGLTAITIPNSVTNIGEDAFRDCGGLTSITIPNSVTSIGDGAFRDCGGLTSITIPNSVTSIGSSAFWNCSGLTSVEFHCKEIGSWFSNNISIKEVIIGDEVTSIGEGAFNSCGGLTSITIPNSVTSIGSSAFWNCSGLTSVEFHCKEIGSWFSNNISIKEVIIGDEVTSIGEGAFNSCGGLISITIPNSVTSIGSSAFYGCSCLTSITIPNSVTSIGSSAFYGCSCLTSITIPNSVTSIGSNAFSGCSGLTSVEFHCKDIELWFRNNISIKEVKIGDEVTSIGDWAFEGCSSLTSITIGNSVTSIGNWAFYGCDLTSVKAEMAIPVAINQNTFSNRANATLYVMKGCKAAYEAADYWNEFKEIVEIDNDNEPTGTSLQPQETTVHIGESERMSIHLENENPIIMFEFYMELPEGLHISMDEDDYLDAELNAARADRTHSLVVEQGADGLYHFLCYSSKNKAFTGNDGEILNVSISCDDNVEAGIYQGKLKNILMSDQNKNAIELADQPFSIEVVDYILGDVNDDRKINGMDIVEMVALIMEQSYMKPADLYPVGQPDGIINGMDLVQEVELVMSQSAMANAPMLAVSAIAPDASHAVAENSSADKLTVADFTIAPGQTYNMAVGLDNPDNQYIMTEFWMSLPEGVSIATNDDGDFVYEEGERFDRTHNLTISKEAEGNAYHFLIYSSQNKALKNNTGTLFTLTLQAEAGAALGDYQGRIYNQVFSDVDKHEHNPAEVTFNVTIGEVDTHVVLDELSTSVPTAATNVNVRVKRTINANEWSTICLPFAMTEAQVKTAFGDEVLLKDFTGYDTVEDDEENIVGITVNFVDAAAIEANHPYLIKVSAPVSEFTVDGVDIDPKEEPTVSFGFTTGKGSKAVYHPIDFNGTYTANTLVPENDLFLSGNKFWYSTGATSMKAFRAYFEFDDVLTEVDEATGARIFMSFDNGDGTTGISDATRLKNNEQINNNWYDLQGRRVQRSMFNVQRSMLKKGLYIKNNKKVVVR